MHIHVPKSLQCKVNTAAQEQLSADYACCSYGMDLIKSNLDEITRMNCGCDPCWELLDVARVVTAGGLNKVPHNSIR